MILTLYFDLLYFCVNIFYFIIITLTSVYSNAINFIDEYIFIRKLLLLGINNQDTLIYEI